MNNGKNCVYDKEKVDFLFSVVRNALFVSGMVVLLGVSALLIYFLCEFASAEIQSITIVISESSMELLYAFLFAVFGATVLFAIISLYQWRFEK